MSITETNQQAHGERSTTAAGEAASSPAESTRRISSEALFRGQNCIGIDHEGARYVLRATRSGKLILTK